FHVTTEAYRRFVGDNDLQPAILEAVRGADTAQPSTLETASMAIADLFARAPMPPEDWPEFQARFTAHLEQFGHAIYDLDFAKAVPADDPTPLIETLKHLVQGQGSDPYRRQQEAAGRGRRCPGFARGYRCFHRAALWPAVGSISDRVGRKPILMLGTGMVRPFEERSRFSTRGLVPFSCPPRSPRPSHETRPAQSQ
ncbi:MAG: hypothetical protein ACYC3V_20340, partial [Chloroflexota bacterium]